MKSSSFAPEAEDELRATIDWYESQRPTLGQHFLDAIVFLELPDVIRVLAIAHGHRRPGYWRHRR